MFESSFEQLFEKVFYLGAGDTLVVREKKCDGQEILHYQFNATKSEKIHIRVDREQDYQRLDEDDGA